MYPIMSKMRVAYKPKKYARIVLYPTLKMVAPPEIMVIAEYTVC